MFLSSAKDMKAGVSLATTFGVSYVVSEVHFAPLRYSLRRARPSTETAMGHQYARCNPHILEAIVAQAPYAALMALRGVTRALKTKAEELIALKYMAAIDDCELGTERARTNSRE